MTDDTLFVEKKTFWRAIHAKIDAQLPFLINNIEMKGVSLLI